MGARRSRSGRALSAAVALALLSASAARTAEPDRLHFTRYLTTGLRLSSVTWADNGFLFTEENTGRTALAGPTGEDLRRGPVLDQGGEELRCVRSPGRRGFPPGRLYCHTPDNRVVSIRRDGSEQTTLASLPGPPPSDGAIVFDDAGTFGHRLVVASGGSTTDGGAVYAVSSHGAVALVGRYPGPGGAENLAQAPPGFGRIAGWALIAVDEDGKDGRVVAVGPRGETLVLASGLPGGANPIVAVPATPPAGVDATPRGLFLAETFTTALWFTPLSSLVAYAGAVLVVAERSTAIWAIRPVGRRFVIRPVPSDLELDKTNFEGAVVLP